MSWLAAQAPSRPGASRLSVGGIGGGVIDAVGASKLADGGVSLGAHHISGAAAAAAAALSMYDDPPEGDVSIEEFEVAAIDRLRGKGEREKRGRRRANQGKPE